MISLAISLAPQDGMQLYVYYFGASIYLNFNEYQFQASLI